MILKLQPDQISTMWDVIKFATLQANEMADASADLSEVFLNDILGKLLQGEMQAWVSFVEQDDQRVFQAISLTSLMKDIIFDKEYLLIHSVFGFQNLSFDIILEAIKTYEQFATMNGLSKIVTMTHNERLPKMYEMLGMQREVFVYSKEI